MSDGDLVNRDKMPLVYSRTLWHTPDGAMMPSNKIVVRVDASFANSALVDRMQEQEPLLGGANWGVQITWRSSK